MEDCTSQLPDASAKQTDTSFERKRNDLLLLKVVGPDSV